ncbi:MAG: hypothetical protein ACOH2G_05135 [Ewingella sp.]
MTDKTDIAALREKHSSLTNDLTSRLTECNRVNYCWDEVSALSAFSSTLLDQLEAERLRADKAELELIKPLPIGELIQRLEGQTYEKWFSQSELKGEQMPVGEIVAWSGTDREKGITREVDFRFLRFDVKPGTKLYAIKLAPANIQFCDPPVGAAMRPQFEKPEDCECSSINYCEQCLEGMMSEPKPGGQW